MNDKQDKNYFSPEEAKKRFSAALRGARAVGHMSMENLTKGKPKKQRKPKKKTKASA